MTINKQALREAAMNAKNTDDWGCDADNFHDRATPDAVLALLDELEAAGKRWAAQDDHINQQADRIESLESKNSGLGKALGAAEKRIAELEAERDKQGRHACELFDEVVSQRQQISELVAAGIITRIEE